MKLYGAPTMMPEENLTLLLHEFIFIRNLFAFPGFWWKS